MDFPRSPASVPAQNEDYMEIIQTLCITFRDKLLVVLSTTCQSDLTEAKKIVEEKLRDILDTTSTLSIVEAACRGHSTSISSWRSSAPESVTTPDIDVEFDEHMLDCPPSALSVAGGTVPTQCHHLDETHEMIVEERTCVNVFASEIPHTGRITCSTLQNPPLEDISMGSPNLIDWASPNSHYSEMQEHENLFPEFLNFSEAEPDFDDWLSNMTWTSSEIPSGPSDGHLAGHALRLSDIHLNSQVAASVTSGSMSDTNSSSPRSGNSVFSGKTPSSSHSSTFDSCSGIQIQEPESPKTSRGPPRKHISRRSTEVTARDQQTKLRGGRPASQLTTSCSVNMDRNEARGSRCVTPQKSARRIDDNESNTISLDLSVEFALGRFSNTEEVFETFRGRLSEDRKHLSSLLMRLFYAVGSPDALRQLRDALDLARKSCMIPVYHASNDLATTVSVLDQLDATTTLSHILRRFHLVRLLEHRSKLESSHKAAKLAAKGPKRRLKYDCALIDLMKRGVEAEVITKKRSHQLKYRSKTQALNDLMRTLYPDLHPDSEDTTTPDGSEYNRKLTKLRNRLSCARNWYQFDQEFPGAILALIPCATGDLAISIDHVEKLPSEVLRVFLDYLKEKRGDFLSKLSQTLSKDLYDILTRRDVTKKFKLEQTDENSLTDCLYDNDQLLELCKTI